MKLAPTTMKQSCLINKTTVHCVVILLSSMPKFKVHYHYNGYGYTTIKAKNKKEAENFFITGENWIVDNEKGTDYEIEMVEEIKN